MNKIILTGYIVPNTANNSKLYNYYEGSDQKRSLVSMLLSVQRPHAKKDEKGYYPTDLFAAKAWGPNADFINKYFNPGDPITVEGYLAIDKGGEKEDGTRYPDRVYVNIESAEFAMNKRGEANRTDAIPQTPVMQTATQSAAGLPFM